MYICVTQPQWVNLNIIFFNEDLKCILPFPYFTVMLPIIIDIRLVSVFQMFNFIIVHLVYFSLIYCDILRYGLVDWCTYASLSLNELTSTSFSLMKIWSVLPFPYFTVMLPIIIDIRLVLVFQMIYFGICHWYIIFIFIHIHHCTLYRHSWKIIQL